MGESGISRSRGGIKDYAAWVKHPGAVTVFFLLVLFIRRPHQVLRPAIWAEEGSHLFLDYLRNGCASIFVPQKGYFLFASKAIVVAALKIDVLHYPQIAAFLANLFTLFVLLSIAYSPTLLKKPRLCALLTLLVPINSEMFGVALFAFWWSGILLFLALVWNRDGLKERWRAFFILLGGFSTPVVVVLSPLFALRWLLTRRREDLWAVALVGFLCALQLGSTYLSAEVQGNLQRTRPPVDMQLFSYLGYFLTRTQNIFLRSWMGGLLCLAIFWLVWRQRSEKGAKAFLLMGALFFSVLIVWARVDLSILHPDLGGPRYFFYPFVLMLWLLAEGLSDKNPYCRWLCAVLLLLALKGQIANLSRHHEKILWKEPILACAKGQEDTEIPVHTVGGYRELWYVKVKSSQCRQLLERSLL